MIHDTKDTVANVTTILGAGSAAMNLNEALTLLLIVTGIVLNLARIVQIKKASKTND